MSFDAVEVDAIDGVATRLNEVRRLLALRSLIMEQRRKKEAEKLAREQLLKKKKAADVDPGLNYNNIF